MAKAVSVDDPTASGMLGMWCCTSPFPQEGMSDTQNMTDEELVRRVAVEVMRWRNIKAFTDDDSGVSGYQDSFPPFETHFDWNPLTDWNHTMEVYDRVPKNRTEHWPSWHNENGVACEKHMFILWVGDEKIAVEDSSHQRAICLAALLSVAK